MIQGKIDCRLKFYAYVHDIEDLTKPVFVKEIEAESEPEALKIAMRDGGVKNIVGKSQTKRLSVRCHLKSLI